MSSSRLTQLIVMVAALAAATAGGWALTGLAQRHVAIVPGIEGCWRLEGSSPQIDCLAREFAAGADRAAARDSEQPRADVVAGYVRSADRRAAQDERLAGLCHPAMHQLGRSEGRAAARAGSSPVFPGGASQLCTAGYVHGLAEGYLTGDPSADVAAVFPVLCHDARARTGCAHGIGHALIRARTADAPGAAADGAITRCGHLPTPVRPDCANGVFMELAMRTTPARIAVDEYAGLCAARVDTVERLACYGYLTVSFDTNDVDQEAVPGWCAKAPASSRFTCIEGYGRTLGARRVAECEGVGRRTLEERCIEGAIALQVGSGHVSAHDARAACGKLDAHGLESWCTDAVRRYTAGRRQVEST